MGKERKNPINIFKNILIKKAGVLDFDGMFALIPDFASQYNYDCVEKKHSEKSGATGTYIESNWYLERKVTYYVKFIIEIEFLVRDMNTVVVEDEDGNKKKRNQGRVEILFNAKMQKNYLNNFKDDSKSKQKSFSDFLRVIYEKYIGKKRLKDYEDKLEDEARDILEDLKEKLE
ncbi:MAG: hypothetical protein WC852_04040 [Candidatus Nanoarchaeia archaeon]|jgi:hypothetical protein